MTKSPNKKRVYTALALCAGVVLSLAVLNQAQGNPQVSLKPIEPFTQQAKRPPLNLDPVPANRTTDPSQSLENGQAKIKKDQFNLADDLTERLIVASVLRSAWHDPTRDDSTEPDRPKAWVGIEASLRKAVNEHRWFDAAVEVERLEALLPSPMRVDYPWDWDTLLQFRAGRAQLLFLGGSIDSSKDLCNQIIGDAAELRKDRSVSEGMGQGSYAMVNVDELLAQIHAFDGDYVSALKYFEKSLDDYWSGCGNCEDSSRQWSSPVIQVLSAAALSEHDALRALDSILAGDIRIEKSEIIGTDAGAQRKHGRIEAEYVLAQFALRRGDSIAIRKHLQSVVDSDFKGCDAQLIAMAWLSRLGSD